MYSSVSFFNIFPDFLEALCFQLEALIKDKMGVKDDASGVLSSGLRCRSQGGKSEFSLSVLGRAPAPGRGGAQAPTLRGIQSWCVT